MSCWKQYCMKLPQRWVFALMGFLAFFNVYTMRVCMSIAITEMVLPINKTAVHFVDDTCPSYDEPSKHMTPASVKGTYAWSEYTQGVILSSFYWGYVVTHVPGSAIAEKFGGKHTVGIGILFAAIVTLLTPVAVEWGSSTALIVVRVLLGLAGGTALPAMTVMISQWAPPEERSKIGSFVFAGLGFGAMCSLSISGIILRYSNNGWPDVFYLFGGLGIIWFLFWIVLCYDNPREHPFISKNEAQFLHERLSPHTHVSPPPVPWRHLFTSPPVWALIIVQTGSDWGTYTISSDLPKYMSSVLKFSVDDNGYLNSLHYVGQLLVCIISSWIADWLIDRNYLSRTNVRKVYTSLATLGPAVFILAACYAGCDRILVVAFFTIGMSLLGCGTPGRKVNVLDVAPNYAGTLMAVTNGFGAFAGILAPYTIGVLTPNQTLSEWRTAFWIVVATFVFADIVYVLFASGEVQEWNDPKFNRKKRTSTNKESKNVELLTLRKL